MGGPGKKEGDKYTPVSVTPGITIMFNKYSGVEFKGNDKSEFIVVKESDVLAILE